MKVADHLEHRILITQPDRWPCHPFLPLIRRRPGGRLDLGVLYHDPEREFAASRGQIVFLTNLLLVPSTRAELLALPQEAFASLDALLDAGWRVD